MSTKAAAASAGPMITPSPISALSGRVGGGVDGGGGATCTAAVWVWTPMVGLIASTVTPIAAPRVAGELATSVFAAALTALSEAMSLVATVSSPVTTTLPAESMTRSMHAGAAHCSTTRRLDSSAGKSMVLTSPATVSCVVTTVTSICTIVSPEPSGENGGCAGRGGAEGGSEGEAEGGGEGKAEGGSEGEAEDGGEGKAEGGSEGEAEGGGEGKAEGGSEGEAEGGGEGKAEGGGKDVPDGLAAVASQSKLDPIDHGWSPVSNTASRSRPSL